MFWVAFLCSLIIFALLSTYCFVNHDSTVLDLFTKIEFIQMPLFIHQVKCSFSMHDHTFVCCELD